METTTNYNLNKPGASDYVDISVLNANMDTVDTQLKNAQNHRESSGIHVTAAQKTKWDGYETVHTLTHSKTGTVHALTGLNGAAGILSCQFKATAAFAAGNTLKVDGTSYTIKLTNGEDAEDNLFVSGAIVSCIVDTSGKTVNFKAGGGGYKKDDVIAPENLEPVYGPISTDLFVGKAALHGLDFTSTSSAIKPSVTKNGTIWAVGWVNGGGYISKTTNSIRIIKRPSVLTANPLQIAGDDTSDDYVYFIYKNSNSELILSKYNFTTDVEVWAQTITTGYLSYAGLVYESGTIYGGVGSVSFRIDASGSNFTSKSLSYGNINDVCLDKDGNVYACSSDGYILELNKSTLSAIWAKQIETDSSMKVFRFINAWDFIYTGRSDGGKLYRCDLSGSVVASKTISSGTENICPIPNASETAVAILLRSNNDQYLQIVDANFDAVDGTSNNIKAITAAILMGGMTIGNDGNIWLVKMDDIVCLTGPLQGYTVKEVVK